MASRIRIASILSVAATATMVAGLASLAAQAIALGAALGPLIGLLGLIPALTFGAVGGVASLLIAFHGLGAAMKQTGGGAGRSADAIAAAERRVEMAQRSATDAQKALNDARETAAQRLRDVSRELARAALDERGALLAVTDARRQLREARMSGDRNAVIHAELALAEAQQSVIEVSDRLNDVQAEAAKRQQQGVEGSDEVQQALQRQADAVRELADAQKALKAPSGGGGVDKAAEAYAKLSTAGKQLVTVLRGLGPQWSSVARSIQQATLTGVAHDIQSLAAVWLPILRVRLSQLGTGWNLAFRGTAKLATSKAFVTDMNAALGNMATFWQRVGRSFAPFESGFRHWTVVGATFLPGIGSWVQSIAERFDHWSRAARESGRAHEWIQNALTVLDQTWDVVKHLSSAIAGIFRAGSGGPNWMPGLVAGTKALSDWINSPAGQGKLAAVFTTLRDIGSQLWSALTKIGPALLNAFADGSVITDTMSVFGVVIGFAADHLEDFAAWLPVIAAGFLIYKAATAAAVALEVIRIPLLVAMTVSNFALAGAMRASQAATVTSTAATWGLNVAWLASPITWIILGIVALIAVIVLIATKTQWFQWIWARVWAFLKMIGSWFAGPFADFFVRAWHNITDSAGKAWQWIVDKFMWLVTLPGRISAGIAKAAKGMWDSMVSGLKSALNGIIWLINGATSGLNSFIIDNINRIPGVNIPHIPPIPFLDKGGDVLKTGLAVIHKDETVLPARVRSPGSTGGGGSDQPVHVSFHTTGSASSLDAAMLHWFRKSVRLGHIRIRNGRLESA